MYKLSKDLIVELENKNITYCHWKSNVNLHKALNGYDDLDLLVKEDHMNKFLKIIFSLGFKEAINHFQNIETINHYYGFDVQSGEILHLHVYSKILTGPSWTKSYLFNLNSEFFKTREDSFSGMKLPKKSIELVIFIFRIYLKLSSGLELLKTLSSRNDIIKEIDYLSKGINKKEIQYILNRYFPEFNYIFFQKILNSLICWDFIKFFFYSIKVRFLLRKYSIYSVPVQIIKSIYQFCYRVTNKLILKQKKVLLTGGKFIVITGLDASGKSSMIKIIQKWLGLHLNVRTYHFGRPAPTILTFIFNIPIFFFKYFHKDRIYKSRPNLSPKYGFIGALRKLILSYDRFILSKTCKEKAGKGIIVLCDRYKSEKFNLMDSKALNPIKYGGFNKLIARLENKNYDKMPIPDLLIHLQVELDVALKRNRIREKVDKESDEELELRFSVNKNIDYSANNVIKVDTDKEYNEVINEVKKIIWDNILN